MINGTSSLMHSLSRVVGIGSSLQDLGGLSRTVLRTSSSDTGSKSMNAELHDDTLSVGRGDPPNEDTIP